MRCEKCGVEMVAGSAFCASCGQPAVLSMGERAGTVVATSSLSPNVAGALCYLGGAITGVLFLILEPYRRDRFVRFHAFQAIFFTIGWIVLYVAMAVLESLMPWALWHVMALLSMLISFGLFFLALWLIYRAYNNERFKVFVIGDLAEKQA